MAIDDRPGDILDTPEAGAKVIRGSALRGVSYGSTILLSLISIPLLIRYLGVEDYGRYATVMALVLIVSGLTEAGLSSIGVREYSTLEGGARGRFMRALLGIRLSLTFAGSAAAIAFALAAGYSATLVAGVVVGGVGLMIATVASTYGVALASTLRLGWIAVLEVLRQVVTVVGIVVLVLADAPLLAFFVVPIAAYVADLAVLLIITRSDVPRLPTVDAELWREVLANALPFAAATAIGFIYYRTTILVMSIVSTEEQTGFFSAPFRIVEVLGGVAWLLVNSAFPVLARAARDDTARLRYALQKLFEVALIVGTFLAITTAVAAPFVMEVVAGESFAPSIGVLRIQGASLVATFLIATWAFALLSLRRHAALVKANTGALIVAIGMALLLAPNHGARGAAYATLTAELALAAMYAWILMGRGSDLRASPRVLAPLALAVGVALAVALVLPATSYVDAAAAALVYFVVLLLARGIPAEVFDALPHRLRSSRLTRLGSRYPG